MRYDTHGWRDGVPGLAAAVGVLLLVLAWAPTVWAKPSGEPFEISPGSFHFSASTLSAGAHEDLTTQFDFVHNSEGETNNDVRDVVVELPVGFMGNATAVPTCDESQLTSGFGDFAACPVGSQVGIISFEQSMSKDRAVQKEPVLHWTVPLYNMEVTSPGITAEFAFKAAFITQFLYVNVRPGDSGLTVTTPNIANLGEIHNISVTVWGVPAAHEHDALRGYICDPISGVPPQECAPGGGGQEAHIVTKPYLSMPTSCAGQPLTAHLRADSWEHPGVWSEAYSEVGPVVECDRIPFAPSIEARPTTDMTESPSGLDVSLLIPQNWESPEVLAASTLKDTTVALPIGYTVNPSAGSGLDGCTREQYEAETASSPPGAGCPPQSKLGKVDIETPVLAEKIKGNVYLAMPYENRPEFGTPDHPGGSLLALYVVAKAPDRGVIIKAAGWVQADSVTGQLVTTFKDTPQQPFDKLTLELKQGQTSPLVSPPACGGYTVHAALTPWSAPQEPRLSSNEFHVERGIGGGPCPPSGIPPFNPTIFSGTQDNNAGNYTPFYLRIIRNDGEQEITKFTTVLPPGLTANLTGIPFCPDAAIEVARQATGRHEIDSPSCPAASEIGHTLVGAGVGGVLAWTPGKLYLAGSYHGSALSLVSVTSATVGPFDLGTVVIRFALRINSISGQAEIDSTGSDSIPHIIDGIVVHVRDIHVYVDRSHFMINPTSCEPMQINETITGAGADPVTAADDRTIPVGAHFQAADCATLGFKPHFTASVTGKTSRNSGAGLTVKLAYPSTPQGTQANIHMVKVSLPKQLPSRLPTLQKACLNTVFDADPAACPPASRVGTVKAITPILPVALEGPAYFVSYGGAKFPELVIVLQGYGVTIDLHGETFISKGGVTSSTFHNVPDEPVRSFELHLPQGPYSALGANGTLCTSHLRMPTTFIAQNGLVIKQNTPITPTGCPRHKPHHHKHTKHKHKHKKK